VSNQSIDIVSDTVVRRTGLRPNGLWVLLGLIAIMALMPLIASPYALLLMLPFIGYSIALLDCLIAVSVACAALGYALYTVDPNTIALHGTNRLFLTFPFVLYGLFRYLELVYTKGGGGDPAWEMLRNPHLIAATVGWLGATGWFLAG